MKAQESSKLVEENPVESKYSCHFCSFSTNVQQRLQKHLKTHSNEKPFKCPECPYKTRWKSDVDSHFQNIHLFKSPSSRPFPCPESGCNYAAKQKSSLKEHSKIHSDQKSYFCSHPNCHYSTNYKQSLISHIRLHTGEKPFACQFESCSSAFVTSGQLQVHSRTHTKEKPFKCQEPNCEYSTGESSKLKSHQLIHPPKEGEERQLFNCPLCEFSAKRKRNLLSHIKTHTLEKLFKCDEPNCNFEAKTKSNLKKHKVVHSDENPFACSFESCEYRCKRQSHLDDHLKTHSEERRYKCELCPYRGKQRQGVLLHIKSVHSDPKFRPFKCTELKCNYVTKTKSDLNNHLLIHKGDKKYGCSFPDCQYKAIFENMVKQHQIAVHETEKNIKCSLCSFATKAKSSLTVHIRTHTKEMPYVCKEKGCEYRAKQSTHLKRHQQRNHPNIFKQSK